MRACESAVVNELRSNSFFFPPTLGRRPKPYDTYMHGPPLQTLKALKEKPFRFTTCHEDAVPDESSSGVGQGGGYTELECCLCIPMTSAAGRQPSCGCGDDHPPQPTPNAVTVQRCDSDEGAIVDSTVPSAGGGVAPSLAVLSRCSTWRVVPARIAISLRLERLARSRPRPPYNPSCAPAVGPVGSVCRLRLNVLSGGASVRTQHPESLLPRCSQLESPTLVIGWNGREETAVGQPPSEWRVRVPPAHGDPLCPPDLSTASLLAIPRDCRDRLVLTLGVVASAPRAPSSSGTSKNTAEEGKEKEAEVKLGSVLIDWNGLSRLPTYPTGYFVDARLSSTSGPVVPQPVYVDLELVAARSPLLSAPPAATRPAVTADQEEVTLSSDMLVARDPGIGGANSGATAENAAPNGGKHPMGDKQAEGQQQEQEQKQEQEQEQVAEATPPPSPSQLPPASRLSPETKFSATRHKQRPHTP